MFHFGVRDGPRVTSQGPEINGLQPSLANIHLGVDEKPIEKKEEKKPLPLSRLPYVSNGRFLFFFTPVSRTRRSREKRRAGPLSSANGP